MKSETLIHNLQRLILTDRQLFDLELIMVDAFAPLKGFLNQMDYESVLQNMRLEDGSLWPIPVVLDISKDTNVEIDESILLCDIYGNPLATLTVQSIYIPDKLHEAQSVYGTTSLEHPGVKHLMQHTKEVYIGGSVRKLALQSRYDYNQYRFTPEQLKSEFKKRGWDEVIAFQTRNPMHRVHFELVKKAHEKTGLPVLIHPVVGLTQEGDIDYISRVKTYEVVAEKYAKEFTMLALLPLAMRMAGPREALWHMLIRKNYGATHFIVGRDHAGPGKNTEGKSFYGPLEAQELVHVYADEINIKVMSSPELVYSETKKEYIPVQDITVTDQVQKISGTEFRKLLRNNESVPDWFTFEETLQNLRKTIGRDKKTGVTIFFTGLSGAGKSTIANMLAAKLLEFEDRKVTVLDGDVIRNNLTKELGFSKEHRHMNVARVGYVASEITKHGGIAVCSMIAPYTASRSQFKDMIEQYGKYIEVYVSTSLSVCEDRDTKGLYKKARQGLIKDFTGIDDPYEEPLNPTLKIDTAFISAEEAVGLILQKIE